MFDPANPTQSQFGADRSAADIQPFRITIPQGRSGRPARPAGPHPLAAGNFRRGLGTRRPVDYLKDLAGYWAGAYDWRAAEAELNQYPQFTTEIDGANIHFLHIQSPEPGALPLILTHGWPGSIVEFLDVIGPLTDPRSHGGNPADAFHLVISVDPELRFFRPDPRIPVGMQNGSPRRL